LYILK